MVSGYIIIIAPLTSGGSLTHTPNLDAGTHLTSGGFPSLTFELTAPASPPTSGPLLSAFSPFSLTPDIHVAASGTHLTPGDSPPLSAAYGAPLAHLWCR